MKNFTVLLISVLCFGEINWEIEIVDSFSFGYDLALDSAQIPHIIYFKGNRTFQAVRHDTGWSKEILDFDSLYRWCSVVFDKNNNEHVCYYFKPHGMSQIYLRYARYDGNTWTFQDVDSVNSIQNEPCVSIDVNSQCNPGIAYTSFNPADSVFFIKYAYFDGLNWNISVVEYDTGCGSINQPSDQYPHLKFNSQDIPHIAYHHIVGQTDTIKLAYWNDSLGRWVKDNVYNHSYGCAPISFALNKEDEPYIAHGVDVGLYCSSRHHGIWYHDYTGIDIGWLNTTFSLDLDSLSRPHIIYTVMGSAPRYCFKDTIWRDVGYLDTGNSFVGRLVIDRDNRIHLIYNSSFYYSVKYAKGTPTGIEENDTGSRIDDTGLKMQILPNISYGFLNVAYNLKDKGKAEIIIYDVSGAKRKSIRLTNCQPGHYLKTINLNDLAGGVYFVVLKQNYEKVSKKFLLIR